MNHLSTEEIAQYIDALKNNKLDKLPRHIIEHIEACDDCASEIIDIYETFKQTNEAKANKKNGTVYYILGSAAAAIFLLVFFNNALFTDNSNLNDLQIADNVQERNLLKDNFNSKIDSLQLKNLPNLLDNSIEPNKKLLAEAFINNKELEMLSARFEGTLRGNEIEIISTNETHTNSGKTIRLEWKNPQQSDLTIEIFNNMGVKIKTSNLTGNYFDFSGNKGLYYWKLFNEDFDLLYCGKIIIK